MKSGGYIHDKQLKGLTLGKIWGKDEANEI